MLFSKIARTITKSPARLNSRGLASGLPKFDEFSKITMKQLWPAVVVILGIYGACYTVNPLATMSMEPNKWTKQ